MKLNPATISKVTDRFDQIGLLPTNARHYLQEMADDEFVFHNQLWVADSIHLHIKVADVANLPASQIRHWGGEAQNVKEGYIKYAFRDGLNFIFSSIPVSQEEKAGLTSFDFPHLDHIGIDIRSESEETYRTFNAVTAIAYEQKWPLKRQGGDGKNVYCCHAQVNEKYWLYPPNSVFWEFAFGKLLVSEDVSGCDLRPANPALGLQEPDTQSCCATPAPAQSRLFIRKETSAI